MSLAPGLDVSRETMDQLDAFTLLVQKWTQRINLVSAASAGDLWSRHVIDSAQLYPLAKSGWTHWADLGSGGGFPGIVVAIIARHDRPTSRMTLMESDQRKAAFLRTAIRDFDLNAVVICDRAESIDPLNADVVSARAFGPLAVLLSLAKRHLGPGGLAILPKGRRYGTEIDEARVAWDFDVVTRQSVTDPEGQILLIERIAHA